MERSFVDDATQREASYEGVIDTGVFETGSNSYLGGNVQVNGMIGLFTEDSAPVSPIVVVSQNHHHRTRTLNPT
jgi:hypothetical protein